jgi:hypothetical protein
LSSRQFPLLWVYRLAPFDTSAPEGLFVASASTTNFSRDLLPDFCFPRTFLALI